MNMHEPRRLLRKSIYYHYIIISAYHMALGYWDPELFHEITNELLEVTLAGEALGHNAEASHAASPSR
jgi:hypothetical protein